MLQEKLAPGHFCTERLQLLCEQYVDHMHIIPRQVIERQVSWDYFGNGRIVIANEGIMKRLGTDASTEFMIY